MYASDSSALRSLESLTSNEDLRPQVYGWIAKCHEFFNRTDDAVAAYELAAAAASSDEERAEYVASLAASLAKTGRTEEALRRVSGALRGITASQAQATLYRTIGDIEKSLGRKRDAALAYEMVAYNRPEDAAARFGAAYAQGDAELSHLSCANYDTLLRSDPSHISALNNQGVTLDDLGMPIRSVSMYRRAAEQNSTVAMANLAFKLLKEGFAKEAEEYIANGRAQADPHENIGLAMSRLVETREKESEALKGALQRGAQEQRFFHAYYPTLLTSAAIEEVPAGEWSVRSTLAELTMKGNHLVAEWADGSQRRRVEGNLENRAGPVRIHRLTKWPIRDEWRPDAGVDGFAYFDDRLERLVVLSTERGDDFLIEVCRKPEVTGARA